MGRTVRSDIPLRADPYRPALPALLAAALAAAVWLAGLHGGDLAAQVYRTDLVRRHGLVLWDPGWYGGQYPLSYSVLTPLLGAAIGLGVLAAASAAVATLAFDRLTVALLGRRTAGSWYFAASTLLAVAIGQVAYLAGEAVALAALLALLRRFRALAVALAAGVTLLSPLAAAFLVLVCGVWAVHDRSRRAGAVATGAGAAVVVGLLGLAFPGDGPFPFSVGSLLAALALSALLACLPRAPAAVRTGAWVYAAACLASWAVPNPIGGNAPRLAESAGVPLAVALLSASRLRGKVALVAAAVVAALAVWQWGPGLAALRAASPSEAPSTTASFYQPLVRQLEARSRGPVRVEVVPTAQHWESAYVPDLARGWERQLDVRDNPIFYRPGALTTASYRRWLVANGVRWVALSDAPADSSGRAEAALLRSGAVAGLRLAWSDRSWRLWRVEGGPGLLSGPGRLTALGPDRVTVQVSRPGRLVLRVRYNRYWRARSGVGCVAPGAGGWTVVEARRAGTFALRASLLGGGPSATC